MANKKRVHSLDDAPVDVFESLKRVFIKRGIIRGRRLQDLQSTQAEAPSKKDQSSPKKEQDDQWADGPEKLLDLTVNAHEILFEAQTVFPFTLFPDTITVDREKLAVANRSFFKVATIHSVPVSDVQSIEAHVGPIFGSLTILRTSMAPSPEPIIVRFLWREDAVKIQHLVQGYIIAHQKDVDFSNIDKDQLLTLLNDLGQGIPD